MARLRRFKILVIQHLLKNNSLAKSGDVVDENKFINLQDSMRGGYVEEVLEDEAVDKKSKDKSKEKKADKSKEKKADKIEVEGNVETETELELELKKIKRLNKESLIAYATENKITIDAESNKLVILESIITHVSKN